jgi:hypothetical protein
LVTANREATAMDAPIRAAHARIHVQMVVAIDLVIEVIVPFTKTAAHA